MTNSRDEKLFRDFLEDYAKEKAEGYTNRNISSALFTLSNQLLDHKKECVEYREETKKSREEHDRRITALEALNWRRHRAAEVELADRETLPPMREREDSSHNLAEFTERVKQAAIEGYERPDQNPDDRVRAVFAEEQKRREEQHELERLREGERLREIAKKERAKIMRRIAIAVIGSGGFVETMHQLIVRVMGH